MKKNYRLLIGVVFVLALFLSATNLFSQTMSGMYTIGDAPENDFTSFSMAVDTLMLKGVSGAVVILADSGTYAESFTIESITGTSADNTITFKGYGDNTKIFYENTATDDNPLILLDGASYIIFDSLMIESGDEASGQTHLLHCYNSTHHITVKDCYLKVSAISGGNGIVASANVNTNNTLGSNLSDFSLINTRISGGTYGTRLWNSSDTHSDNMEFIGNTLSNYTFAGINVRYSDKVTILDNDITSKNPTDHPRGIFMHNLYNSFRAERNHIKLYGVNFIYGITLKGGCSFDADSAIMANNFVTQMIPGTNSSYVSRGIFFEGKVENLKILNNSIRLNGTQTNASCIWVANSASTGIYIQNNILANINNGYCLYFTGTSFPDKVIECDYNNFYYPSAKAGYYNGTTCNNITDWQAATSGIDINSVSVDPMFLSDSDLHIDPENLDFNDLGFFLSEVPSDIDGDVRNESAPDIGADEFGEIFYDILVNKLIAPMNCDVASDESEITIQVQNNSEIPVSDIPVSYIINGLEPITEFIAESIGVGDSLAYSFDTKANLSNGGDYIITAFSLLEDDTVYTNDTIINSVFINATSLDLGADTAICPGEILILDAGDGFDWYFWSTTEETQTITIDADELGPGDHAFSVMAGISDCEDEYEAIIVTVFDAPVVDLGDDITIYYYSTPDTSIVLDAGSGFAAYLWSTGDTGQTITIDVSLGLGQHLFSVDVTDANGCISTDSVLVTVKDFITDLENQSINPFMELFPNPASDILNILFETIADNSNIRIMDSKGMVVHEETAPSGKKSIQLDVSQLPSGLYFIELNIGGVIARKKFIHN